MSGSQASAGGRIDVEVVEQVLVVTMNRPDKHNALTPSMFDELEDRFREFEHRSSLRAAVLTGAGDRAFCAGGDLVETLPRVTAGDYRVASVDPTRRFMSEVTKPIVAAVNGLCIAGGLELLLGTDIRLCVPGATFGLGEVRWGLIAAGGSHVRLPRQIPYAVAMQLLLTGERIDARRAREVGLVNEVVPADVLLTTAIDVAGRIARSGPSAARGLKESAVRGLQLEEPFVLEGELAAPVFASQDAVEGPTAFAERRPPRFRGR